MGAPCRRGWMPNGYWKKRKSCPGRCRDGLSVLQGREVALFEDDSVMERMAGDDEGEGQDGDFLAAGVAATQPGGVVERAEEGDCGPADGGEFLQQIGEFARGGVRGFDVIVLFEARERGLIAAGDAEHAIGKDALGVIYVTKSFLDGPLAGFIAKVGLCFCERFQ